MPPGVSTNRKITTDMQKFCVNSTSVSFNQLCPVGRHSRCIFFSLWHCFFTRSCAQQLDYRMTNFYISSLLQHVYSRSMFYYSFPQRYLLPSILIDIALYLSAWSQDLIKILKVHILYAFLLANYKCIGR